MYTSSQNFAVVQTELDKVFDQEWTFQEGPGYATASTAEIFRQATTDRASHIEETIKKVGLFPKISESQDVPTETPRVTNKKTTLIADFADGVEMSKNMFDDDQHSTVEMIIRDFATKARATQDSNAFGLYRGSFTTTLTNDGVAFISASHPLIGGGTESNLVTGALSSATLNDAMVRLAEMKDQSGVVMGNQANALLVPVDLFKKAKEITDSQLESDTADNNINVWRSTFGYTVWTSPYLGAVNPGGSDTAWWLLSRNHSVTRIVRQGIETNLRDWTFSNNRTYFYQANFREEVYVSDYVGAVGSLGQ